jgi:hypothetical protein
MLFVICCTLSPELLPYWGLCFRDWNDTRNPELETKKMQALAVLGANSLPGRRIKLEQKLFLFFHQRKITVHLGAKCVGSTRRRPAAHQVGRVVVVPESDRMAQLVGYDIAGYVRKRERRQMISPDCYKTLSVAEERACEGNKIPVR